MMNLHMNLVLPLAAVIGLSAACGSDPQAPDGDDPQNVGSGEATFTYQRAAAEGTFEAEGKPTIEDGDAAPGTWATGVLTEDGSAFALVAMRDAGTDYDYLIITIPGPVAGGQWSMDPECEDEVCAAAMVAFAMDGIDTATGDAVCYLQDGTISLGSLTDETAKGSFSGTGMCMSLAGEPPTAFSIASGSFEVALGPPLDL